MGRELDMEPELRPDTHSPQGRGGPQCSPGSPPPLLRPWRAQACCPWGRRPGRGRTPARVLSGCWRTVPAAPRWPGDSQLHPCPASPHPHSPAAPQCPGRQRAQGGRGRPAMNMEEMAVSRVKGGLSQPLDARGLAPHFRAESPRPRRQGSPPGRGSLSHGLCSSEVPSHPPRLLPAGVGPSAAHRAVWPLAPP